MLTVNNQIFDLFTTASLFCLAKQTNMSEDEQNRKVLVYPSCLAEDIAAVRKKRGRRSRNAASGGCSEAEEEKATSSKVALQATAVCADCFFGP